MLEDLKGLSLQQALLHMRWYQKPTAAKVNDALKEAIIQAKEEGFDLQKTYIGWLFSAVVRFKMLSIAYNFDQLMPKYGETNPSSLRTC